MKNITLPLCPICTTLPIKHYYGNKYSKTCCSEACRYELTNQSNGKISRTEEELKEARRTRQRLQYQESPNKFKDKIKTLRSNNLEYYLEYERAQYYKHQSTRLEYFRTRYTEHREELQRVQRELYYRNVQDYEHNPLPTLRRMLNGARMRSKKAKLEFDLTLDYLVLILPTFCPVLGIKLSPRYISGTIDTSPSLDRVDCKRGYTKDNTIIVSLRANYLKRDASMEEIALLYKFYCKPGPSLQ